MTLVFHSRHAAHLAKALAPAVPKPPRRGGNVRLAALLTLAAVLLFACDIFTAKTAFWSCNGLAFAPDNSSPGVVYSSQGYGDVKNISGQTIEFVATVQLPQGSTISSVVVKGTAGSTWTLFRTPFDFSNLPMASATLGTAVTTISNPDVDNQTYAYWIRVTLADQAYIYGAEIAYTYMPLGT